MTETNILKKLRYQPDMKAAVINAPAGFATPAGAATSLEAAGGRLDFVLAFVKTAKEAEAVGPRIKGGLKPDGLLWMGYPKGGAKAGTDLNRDVLWALMEKFGLAGVAMVAIDQKWAAMRFRPAEKVGK